MTVVKYRALRIVLEVMRPGVGIEDVRPEVGGAVVIQVLSGRMSLGVKEQRVELGAGRLVSIDLSMPSELTALEESALLIWFAPEEAGATRV